MSLFVHGKALGSEQETLNGQWLICVLLVLLFSKEAMAPITVAEPEVFAIQGKVFTLSAQFPPGSIDSATWSKQNGNEKQIADCHVADNHWYGSYQERAECKLQNDMISLTLRHFTPIDAGFYGLETVTKLGFREKSTFTVKPYVSVSIPIIESHPETIKEGINLTLICKTENGTKPTFNWKMDSAKLANDSRRSTSENGTVLTVTKINPSDCVTYTCVVQNNISQEEKHFNISGDADLLCEQDNGTKKWTIIVIVVISVAAFVACLTYGLSKVLPQEERTRVRSGEQESAVLERLTH
ncbi:hepatic and glial cell adhesion molecule-like isoform X2 [Heptranchias perlo]|uniref:hepatic and glial cell adhesion molecule-like isoform X2 n=1 Tax=Heptranchias perlo TaxID=212740 RepID=UPI003559FBBE